MGDGYAIVGCGRLGCVLATALSDSGRMVSVVQSRRLSDAEMLAQRLKGAVSVQEVEDVPARARTLLLTVPDAAIGDVAGRLPVSDKHAVVHCSGATDLSALSACETLGAAVGCFHPLQSFPDRHDGAARLRGVTIGIEAAGLLDARLRGLAADLEAHVLRLEGVDRASYHAGAVFVSNYLVALFAAAGTSWTKAGLSQEAARKALYPLARGALEAVAQAPLARALTGPVARGDATTVATQLAALSDEPALAQLYRQLAGTLMGLGVPRDRADREALSGVLAGADKPDHE